MDVDSKKSSLLKRSKNPERLSEAVKSKITEFYKIDDGVSLEMNSILSKSTHLNYQMDSDDQSLSQVSSFSAGLSKS